MNAMHHDRGGHAVDTQGHPGTSTADVTRLGPHACTTVARSTLRYVFPGVIDDACATGVLHTA